MTRRYTPEEKTEALALLEAHHGNIGFTHLQTGIPERTLYSWRRSQWQEQKLQQLQRQNPLSPPPQKIPEFENTAEALKFLREQMTEELLNIAASFKDDLAFSTPYQRVLVLSRLLDRLLKLDSYLPDENKSNVFRIEFMEPDGTIYETPPLNRWNEQEKSEDADLALDDQFSTQEEDL